jgi:hypothetical protein
VEETQPFGLPQLRTLEFMFRSLIATTTACLVLVLSPSQESVAEAPTAPVATTTTTTTLVSQPVMAQWAKVAWCETHANWGHKGSVFEGGLGIMPVNWVYYGGLQYAPHAWLATPEQQVAIAVKIQHGLPAPDQDGTCHAW